MSDHTTSQQFEFRVSGLTDNYSSRRNYDVPYEETFTIVAESVGDALNELVNRSGMWETLDMERGFTIEFVPPADDEVAG